MLNALVLVGLTAQAAPLRLDPADLRAIEAAAAKSWPNPKAPGGVVAITSGGQVIWSKAYGMADMELGVPMRTDHVFDVGSVSKQFTASLIHLLALEGKLDLDAEVQSVLTDLPRFSEPITFRQLLHHTSGLRDYFNLMLIKGENIFGVPITDEATFALVKGQRDLNFTPGTQFIYCNTGYFLLAKTIEKVTGRSVQQNFRDRIGTPLGMTRSRFDDLSTTIIPGRVQSYAPGQNAFLALRRVETPIGDGGLLTTIDDLAKWAHNFHRDALGGGKLVDALTQRIRISGEPNSYASGIIVNRVNGVQVVSHGGAWLGFRAEFSALPNRDLGIIVLANDSSTAPQAISSAAIDALLDVPAPVAEAAGPFVALTGDDLKAVTGRYTLSGTSLAINVSQREGKLFAQATGQSEFPLTQTGPREFSFAEAGITITFAEAQNGQVPEFTLNQGGRDILAKRAVPFVVSPEARAAWVGTYRSPELGIDLVIEDRNGNLAVRINGNNRGFLQLTADQRGNIVPGWTLRLTEESGRKVIRLDEGRVMNLAFEAN